MARRADQLDPEALGVVVRRQNVDHLDVAAVAGAGVGVVDPQRLGEGLLAQSRFSIVASPPQRSPARWRPVQQRDTATCGRTPSDSARRRPGRPWAPTCVAGHLPRLGRGTRRRRRVAQNTSRPRAPARPSSARWLTWRSTAAHHSPGLGQRQVHGELAHEAVEGRQARDGQGADEEAGAGDRHPSWPGRPAR